MSGLGARVSDVRALAEFRPALIRFGEDAQRALSGPVTDAERLLIRLEKEQLAYWKREIRVRSEAAVVANSKLLQSNTSLNPRPSVEARKAYEAAKRRVVDAEDKYKQTRSAILRLRKEVDIYRGSVQPMATIARSDMKEAVGRIDAHLRALDEYTSTQLGQDRKPKEPGEGSAGGEVNP